MLCCTQELLNATSHQLWLFSGGLGRLGQVSVMVPSDWDIGLCLGNRKKFLENACFWFEVLLHNAWGGRGD